MNGSVHATFLPLKAVPPSAAQSFLVAARGLFDGAEALVVLQPQRPLPCAFLAAQALEGALKAFLSHSGFTERQLKSVGHDLEALWAQAASKGLAISKEPAPWCTLLNSSHNKPYYYRYPMGLNGMAFPPLVPMISDLRSILMSVRGAIR